MICIRTMSNFTWHDLEKRVAERARASADVSYTRQLLDGGVEYCAKKLGEEAIETALAAVAQDRPRLIAEAADLIYHLLVVLKARGIALAEVEAALAQRTSQTGLQEKRSHRRRAVPVPCLLARGMGAAPRRHPDDTYPRGSDAGALAQ